MAEILEVIAALGGLITSTSFSSNNSTHTIKENIDRERKNLKSFLDKFIRLLNTLQKILETNVSLNGTLRKKIEEINSKVKKEYDALNELYHDTDPQHIKRDDKLREILYRIENEAPIIVEQMELGINSMMELMNKQKFSSPLIITNNHFSNNPGKAQHQNSHLSVIPNNYGKTNHANSSIAYVASVTPNATIVEIHTPNGNMYNNAKAKTLRGILEKNLKNLNITNKNILQKYKINNNSTLKNLRNKTAVIRKKANTEQLSEEELYILNRSTAHSRAKKLKLGGRHSRRRTRRV